MTTSTASIPATARAVRVHSYGGNDQLKVEEVEVPAAGEGEVLVKVAASGVNPVDWKILRGYLHAFIPGVFPFVPGWELAGTVAARGHAARRFDVGDRVYGYVRRPTVQHGTYAEYVAVPESYLARAPEKLPLEEAAGIPLAALTAYQSLHGSAALKGGETLLIIGASGGVGGFAVQLAKVHGARVIAIASERNREHCKALGADDFIAYDHGSFEAEIATVAGTVDLVYDCTGGDTPARTAPAIKAGGRFASIAASKAPPGFESASFHYVFVEPHSRQLAELAGLADAGKLVVHIDSKLPLAEARTALDMSEKLHTRGKLVLVTG